MDDDSCPELGLTVQNHFKAINMRMGRGGHHQSKHRQSLVTLSRRHSVVQMLDHADLDGPSPVRKLSASSFTATATTPPKSSELLMSASTSNKVGTTSLQPNNLYQLTVIF